MKKALCTFFFCSFQLSSFPMISTILGRASSAACTFRKAKRVRREIMSTAVRAYSFTPYTTYGGASGKRGWGSGQAPSEWRWAPQTALQAHCSANSSHPTRRRVWKAPFASEHFIKLIWNQTCIHEIKKYTLYMIKYFKWHWLLYVLA